MSALKRRIKSGSVLQNQLRVEESVTNPVQQRKVKFIKRNETTCVEHRIPCRLAFLYGFLPVRRKKMGGSALEVRDGWRPLRLVNAPAKQGERLGRLRQDSWMKVAQQLLDFRSGSLDLLDEPNVRNTKSHTALRKHFV